MKVLHVKIIHVKNISKKIEISKLFDKFFRYNSFIKNISAVNIKCILSDLQKRIKEN